MATQATIGAGTTLWVEATVGMADFVKLAEINSVTLPNEQTDQLDVTSMDSPEGYKEFISGLTDPGDTTYGLNHVPNSATEAFIIAWRAARETRSSQVRFKSGATVTFPSFVKGYAPDKIEPSNAMKSALTLKVAGAVVRG